MASIELPAVFKAPIRVDIVNTVHANLAKNHRQAYAVSKYAGAQTSAESWGTGRAVSRIPRVAGGGTHRSGQGAFGNMCRGGRMFAPTKVWRRWHRRVNKGQRRFAVVSALAASAVHSLVQARGHHVSQIPEVPLVLATEELAKIKKTKQALALLSSVHANADIERVKASRGLRAGQGKSRNRRFVQRRGPLLVTNGEADVVHAFRNLAGVEIANVNHLNLLQLAPGGHVGRFIIWTQGAFAALDTIFGKAGVAAKKSGFVLPRASIAHADLGRIINSAEVQTHLRSKKANVPTMRRKNPLTNNHALFNLNPYAASLKRRAIKDQAANVARRDAIIADKRAGKKTPAKKAEHNKTERKNAAALKKTRATALSTLFA